MKRFFSLMIFLHATAFGQDFVWDQPQFLSSAGTFPQSDSRDDVTAVFWQERQAEGPYWSRYYISSWTREGADDGSVLARRLGPFRLSGEDAPIFSFVLGPNRSLWLAVQSEPQQVDIYRSGDLGVTFRRMHTITGEGNLTKPRITLAGVGAPLVVVTEVFETRYRILAVVPLDITHWSPPVVVTDNPTRFLNFNPSVSVDATRIDIVYQSLVSTEEALSYQLFLKTSLDSGLTWEPDVLLTTFPENNIAPILVQNDRPSVLRDGDDLLITWERTPRGQFKRIVAARFSLTGSLLGSPETLSLSDVTAEAAQLSKLGQDIFAVWFDNRRGERTINAARLLGDQWVPLNLRLPGGGSIFGHLLPARRGFSVVGQQALGERDAIFLVDPDLQTLPPNLAALNFRPGAPLREGDFRVRVNFPPDASGTAGYNFVFTRRPDASVPELLVRPATSPEITVSPSEEGSWYLRVASRDGAGNWSQPSTLSFLLDTSPPESVSFLPVETDEEGFLVSNTFTVGWEPPSDATGFTYRLEYLGEGLEPLLLPVGLTPLPRHSLVSARELTWTNIENGLWALSVSAVDEAGNVGPTESLFFRTNKFIPSTRIDRVVGIQDEFGNLNARVLGRGFLAGGTILEVWIDGDGREPFDRSLAQGQFRVVSDREILLENLTEIAQGYYRIGVEHSLRGRSWSTPSLAVDEMGNVKLGDFSNLLWDWGGIPITRWLTSVSALPLFAFVVFFGLLALASVGQGLRLVREETLLRQWYNDVQGRGTLMIAAPAMDRQKIRGFGLQLKFIVSILGLTVSVILMLSVTLGFFITENSQRNLGTGLLQRTEVLLDSLATGARNTLPDEFIRDLGLIPGQRHAMPDSVSVTITGRQRGGGQGTQYVWASDDPGLNEKIGGELNPGNSFLNDEASEPMRLMEEEINSEAVRTLGALNQRLGELTVRSEQLILIESAEAERERSILGEQIERVNIQLSERLRELGRASGSVPSFDPLQLSELVPTYLFYKPVLYTVTGENTFVQGFVRLRVSVKSILDDIRRARNQLIQLTGLIALAALGLGLLGSFLLAAFTVRPIRALVSAVARIRDTEDKEKLKDFSVDIRTGDELALLADTINEMTEGLVKAAAASKDLTLGKEIQKMFIPLLTDDGGRKMTFGRLVSKEVEFFGYYEGAKGVSGDYFDFQRLDDHRYAIIKCDVAGKGVPAALIMVEVATVFLNYFKEWKPEGKPLPLPPLVSRINTLLEERGFKGRFAALTIGIYDTITGIMKLCNAGDTVSNYYSFSQKKMLVRELPKAPAAGVFSTDLVEMQGGFKDITLPLARGDTIFFYTDGVEEAKRVLRDASFQPMSIPAPSGEGTVGDEELGPERVHRVVEAAFSRGRYDLECTHSPWPNGGLTFDFSTCAGTVQDAILAMAGVEQIWRLVPDPKAGSHDRVKFDVAVFDFLKKHFLQFSQVFRYEPVKDELPEYVWLPGLREDDQYDDLTILGMRRNV